MTDRMKKIAIVGGGTAGWVTASCFARSLIPAGYEIELVESPEIGIIGVGEATIPSFIDFIQYLGIAEKDFIQATQATFKLGIKFNDWLHKGHSYWHQFGAVGFNIDAKPFYQHWLKYRQAGGEAAYTDFSPAVAMAEKGKFYIEPEGQKSALNGTEYAWHFDAAKAAQFLQKYAVRKGVKYRQAMVDGVKLHNNGNLKSLCLSNQQTLEADIFIDCSGQKALLINKALGVAYDSWQRYLPVDRAVVVGTECASNIAPYTESTARDFGWQWRIPLQHRIGNGYVYCSEFCSDERAAQELVLNVDTDPISEPRVLRFNTGKRRTIWHKNCVAIGLSAGFLEPLESTSIYLSMKGALSFLEMVPHSECDQASIDEYNRLMDIEFHAIRDFIVMHYCLSKRDDTAFWRWWQTADIPDSLQAKLALFRQQGCLMKNEQDLFSPSSWYAVLEGMGLRPRYYDPTIDASDFSKVQRILAADLRALDDVTGPLPQHGEYLRLVNALP